MLVQLMASSLMAKSLKDYGDFQIYLINIFGEFQNFNDNEIKK